MATSDSDAGPRQTTAMQMETRQLKKGPRTWAKVREAYLSGIPAKAVAKHFGVGVGNLRLKARLEGWTRTAHAAAEEAAMPPEDDGWIWPADRPSAQPAAQPSMANDGAGAASDSNPDVMTVAEIALRQAYVALRDGKANEAQGIIKAGLAVGDFTEVVQEMRTARGLG